MIIGNVQSPKEIICVTLTIHCFRCVDFPLTSYSLLPDVWKSRKIRCGRKTQVLKLTPQRSFYMSHYTMLSKYGNCTRLLKIKNKQKIVYFVGKNSRYFVGVLSKTIIPLALVGYEMIIAKSALRTSWAIHHLISNGSQRALVK